MFKPISSKATRIELHVQAYVHVQMLVQILFFYDDI